MGTPSDDATKASSAGLRVAAELDRVNILTQELDTSLRVPLDQPVLVGGLTQDPAAPPVAADKGKEPQRKQLYLFVRVTLP